MRRNSRSWRRTFRRRHSKPLSSTMPITRGMLDSKSAEVAALPKEAAKTARIHLSAFSVDAEDTQWRAAFIKAMQQHRCAEAMTIIKRCHPSNNSTTELSLPAKATRWIISATQNGPVFQAQQHQSQQCRPQQSTQYLAANQAYVNDECSFIEEVLPYRHHASSSVTMPESTRLWIEELKKKPKRRIHYTSKCLPWVSSLTPPSRVSWIRA